MLGAVTHLPVHMRVAAFPLGVRFFTSPATVVMSIGQVRHLAARNGHLLGG